MDSESGKCTEPKRPAAAYFLFVNHKRQVFYVPLAQLNGDWVELRSEELKWWTAQAEKLKDEYESQMVQWKQHGRYFKTRGAEVPVNPPVPEAVPEKDCNENLPEISVLQREHFIDDFARNCAAEHSMDESTVCQVVASFKAASQRPDVEAASFTKTEFLRIVEALSEKLTMALPNERKW